MSNWEPSFMEGVQVLHAPKARITRVFTEEGLQVGMNRATGKPGDLIVLTMEPADALALARDIEREYGGRHE